jgi:tetrahydromethanopterin S-methyltransferase subunit G
MNEEEIQKRLESLEQKIDSIQGNVGRIYRHQVIRSVLTVILFLLPLIAIGLSIPFLLDFLTFYEKLLP